MRWKQAVFPPVRTASFFAERGIFMPNDTLNYPLSERALGLAREIDALMQKVDPHYHDSVKDSAANVREFAAIIEYGSITKMEILLRCLADDGKGYSLRAAELAGRVAGFPDTFTIYQLKDGDALHYHRFEPLERLQANGLTVERANYDFIYESPLAEGETLDSIYERFNLNHPEDYRGHSLSISDIVWLHKDGADHAYYVDRFGFAEVPQFVEQEKARLNPLETAEKSTEQNYNMIDGIINNQEQAAFQVGADRFLAVQTCDDGYDYTLYDGQYRLLDGGQLDAPALTMGAATLEILSGYGLEREPMAPVDYDGLDEKQAEVQAQFLPQLVEKPSVHERLQENRGRAAAEPHKARPHKDVPERS